MASHNENRVLILAPTSKDGKITANLLLEDGVPSFICKDLPEVCHEFKQGASALIITQEAVLSDSEHQLRNILMSQETWSDIPIIVLTVPGRDLTSTLKQLANIGHMTLIKRPVQLNNFISTIRTALRDRERQYQIRNDLADRMVQAEALEIAVVTANAASVAKSEFLANMSHEIRTPMNAVLGLAHILDLSNPLSDTQRQCIKTIRSSGESLLILINDLLDISKIEASGIEFEVIPFRLDDVIVSVTEMMAVRANEKGLKFIIQAQSVLTKQFEGDPNRIKQILINLCSNAVKFSSNSTIEIGTYGFDSNLDVPTIGIYVKDYGVGISPNKLATIFEKFTQADNTISRKYGGTGLGLTISKTLCELMGGSIDVQSVVGTGSTFTANLPLKLLTKESGRNKVGFTEIGAASELPTSRGCVLLVEDYEANILVASTLIEMFGYDCDIAENGTLAIEKVKKNNYTAILMDVQMPEINGFDATRAIRQFEYDCNKVPTPIIGMTAHALDGDRERCITAGMNDYISKPFSPHDLEKKLESASASR